MGSCLSSSSSRDKKRWRLLEVRVKSANLKTQNRGPFYVNAWIYKDVKLQTERVYGGVNKPTVSLVWERRFVFAVPHTIVSDGKPKISFQIFRSGGDGVSVGLPIGMVQVHLTKGEDSGPKPKYDAKLGPKYDTDAENERDSDYDYDAAVGGEKEERVEEEEEAPERVWSKMFPVAKGELTVELVLWKNYLSNVGEDSRWDKWAMYYDEFMGFNEVLVSTKKMKKKKKKNHMPLK